MIAIPNMEKPKSCYNHCEFIAMEEVGCPLKDYAESHQYKDKIHPGCPLIDIVTCGECKYVMALRSESAAEKFGQIYECRKQIINCPNPSRFCSYGERRTDERDCHL